MKPALVRRTNTRKLVILAVLVILASVAYLTVDVNPKYLSFAMGLRVPMLLVMIAAFAIGRASIVFQSIIHNTIVTPCLLGMNSCIRSSTRWWSFWPGQGAFWPQCQRGLCGGPGDHGGDGHSDLQLPLSEDQVQRATCCSSGRCSPLFRQHPVLTG